MKKIFKLLLVLVLSSCASKKVVLDEYSKAMRNLKAGNYEVAAEAFEKIEDDQPFTKEASNGLIMSAYSYYKAEQYEESIRVIDYFIQSNPISPYLDYMLYLKGLNYYDRMDSMNRAINITENVSRTFKELMYKYSQSDYNKDSEARLKKAETFLSGNELNTANYYLKRKNYIGAMNHFLNVLNNYPNSEYVPESLYRLMQINSILGIDNDANQYRELLITKYKNKDFIGLYENNTNNKI